MCKAICLSFFEVGIKTDTHVHAKSRNSIWWVLQNHGIFGITGLNNWRIYKSQNGTEPELQKGKNSQLAYSRYCSRFKCTLEPTQFGEYQTLCWGHTTGEKNDQLGSNCNKSSFRLSCNMRYRETLYHTINSLYRPYTSWMTIPSVPMFYLCTRNFLENRFALRIKHSYEGHTRAYRMIVRWKRHIRAKMEYYYLWIECQ